jgi:hypothetical protein
MPRFDYARAQVRATEIAQFAFAPDQVAITVTGMLLIVTFGLAMTAIWRGRRREAPQPAMTPETSGFRRWLTPMGMASIPAEQAVVNRPRRKSGAVKTVSVSTPVSKVSARVLKHAGADALEIARRTGLSRDAVHMMMAAADAKGAMLRATVPKPVARPEPTRSVATSRAMVDPSPHAGASAAARMAPHPKLRALGTRLNARLE